MNLFYRPKFLEDMAREELWLLEHTSPEIADRWHESVIRTIHVLAQHPRLGRERKDLRFSGIRSWGVEHFRRWLIFYGIRDQDMIFYRVISGTTNLYALRFE